MHRRSMMKLGLSAAAVTGLGLPSAVAQAKMVLKATDVHPLGYPTVEAVERMGKKLEAATGGRHLDPDVSLDAARRRKGDDRAGPARRPADRAHLGRPDGPARARVQRLQSAVRLPRRRPYGEGHRRRDRRRADEEAYRSPDRKPRRPVLHERRRAQRLQQQEADREGGGSEGTQDPHDGQSAVRRHHECPWRQWRRDGLRSAHQRHADRRGRRCREQRAELRLRPALSLRQILLEDRPPDDPGDPRLFEEGLPGALEGRSGAL